MSYSSSPNSETAPFHSPALTAASSTSSPSTPPQRAGPAYTVVNTVTAIKACVDAIVQHVHLPPKTYSKAHCLPSVNGSSSLQFQLPTTPELYVDEEGISLSRRGELSILIVHVETRTFKRTYLIHVHVLGNRVFYTKSSDGVYTLQKIFNDNRVPKVLFDCRMDSDALFWQFAVLLQGVIDLQLMCLAAAGGGGPGLPGLESCLLSHLDIDVEERAWVSEAKARGQVLWRPRSGGSMQRFNDNPLHEDIINYCVVDAAYLPRLFETYNRALGNRISLTALGTSDDPSWESRVLRLSKSRAEYCLDLGFCGGTGANPWYVHKCYIDDDDSDWDR